MLLREAIAQREAVSRWEKRREKKLAADYAAGRADLDVLTDIERGSLLSDT